MIKGVDISAHNGDVDFNELKNNGIEFCIIRLGWGDDIESQDDPKFIRNIKECEKYNIPFGIYIYSYATNYDEIESEISHALRQSDKCKNMRMFKLGIWFDMEDADGYKDKHGVIDNNDLLCDFCERFCDVIENSGYFAGIYASKYWFTSKLNQDRLNRFAKWVAQWNDECTYEPWAIWQNSSNLIIDEKRFDSNYMDQVYWDYFMSQPEPLENIAEKTIEEIKNILDNYYSKEV